MSTQANLFIDATRGKVCLQPQAAAIVDTNDETSRGLAHLVTEKVEVTPEELEAAMDDVELSEEVLEIIIGGGKTGVNKSVGIQW